MRVYFVIVLILVGGCAAAEVEFVTRAAKNGRSPEQVQKRFVLTLKEGQAFSPVRRDVAMLKLEGKNAQCKGGRQYPKLNMLAVHCESATSEKRVLQLDTLLKAVPGVEHVTPDAMLTCSPSASTMEDNDDWMGPDTPMFTTERVKMRSGRGLKPYNWGLDRMDEDYSPLDNLPIDFSCYPKEGAGVKVFVIDTGCVPWHDEFSETTVETMAAPGSDFKNGIDNHGHGTHIAAVVVGKNVGMARNANVTCIKSFDKHGNGAATDTISAVEYVLEQKSRMPKRPFIVNLSYSALTGFTSTALDDIVYAASAHGIVFVVSAGNAAVNACLFSPSKAEQALTVTASTKRDTLEVDSNIGPCVEFIAPGHEIVSAGIASKLDYVSKNGTSMATPHIVGLSALVLAENRHLQENPATVRDNLYELLVSTRSVEIATFIMPLMETGCGLDPSAEPEGLMVSPSPCPSPYPSPTPSQSPTPSPSVVPSTSPSISVSPSPKLKPGGKAYWKHRREWEMEQDLGNNKPPPAAPNSYYQYGFGPYHNPYE